MDEFQTPQPPSKTSIFSKMVSIHLITLVTLILLTFVLTIVVIKQSLPKTIIPTSQISETKTEVSPKVIQPEPEPEKFKRKITIRFPQTWSVDPPASDGVYDSLVIFSNLDDPRKVKKGWESVASGNIDEIQNPYTRMTKDRFYNLKDDYWSGAFFEIERSAADTSCQLSTYTKSIDVVSISTYKAVLVVTALPCASEDYVKNELHLSYHIYLEDEYFTELVINFQHNTKNETSTKGYNDFIKALDTLKIL